MNEKELLAQVADDLGIDRAHPDRDQMDAAVTQTLSVARALAKRGALLISLTKEDESIPPAVAGWLNTFSDRLHYDGRVCNARHVQTGTPTTLFAATPNVRYCYACTDRRGSELAKKAMNAGGTLLDCDFCGIPDDLHRIRVVVIPVVSVLVRAFGCEGCTA